MNIKRERLVKTAVPSLYRMKDGSTIEIQMDDAQLSALEYSFNDKGTTIDLPGSQPPKRTIHVNLSMNASTGAEDDYNAIIVGESDFVSSEAEPSNSNVMTDTKPILLNAGCPKFAVRNIQARPAIKRANSEVTESISPKLLKTTVASRPTPSGRTYGQPFTANTPSPVAKKTTSSNTYTAHHSPANVNNSVVTKTMYSPSSVLQSSDIEYCDELSLNAHEEIVEEQHTEKVDNTMYMQMLAEQSKQIEDLKILLTEKLSEKNQAASPIQTVSAPIRVEKGPAMSKVQLFNGIRKYLNPSMVALLRMEMFGSSDRSYRPDEKQLSKELYNLNQTVYDYMRDEWRFRLPPKSDVEEWLKTNDDEETWELC